MVELRSRLTGGSVNKNNPEIWDYSIILAPPVRLELTTSKLTASCSTIELQGIDCSLIITQIIHSIKRQCYNLIKKRLRCNVQSFRFDGSN